MYCKYLSKKLNGKCKCKLLNKVVILGECGKCLKFNPHANEPIKKKSNHKEEVTQETYDYVFERDKGRCVLCKTTKDLHLHHINGRSKKLTNDVNNCVMLCRHCHLEVVHKNQKKYRPILLKYIYRLKLL